MIRSFTVLARLKRKTLHFVDNLPHLLPIRLAVAAEPIYSSFEVSLLKRRLSRNDVKSSLAHLA